MLLIPKEKGTEIQSASSVGEIKNLLEGGLTISEAVFPYTVPEHLNQLSQQRELFK